MAGKVDGQMDEMCALGLSESFEEGRNKDAQLTGVKHDRFRRIVSHVDCSHAEQTL